MTDYSKYQRSKSLKRLTERIFLFSKCNWIPITFDCDILI